MGCPEPLEKCLLVGEPAREHEVGIVNRAGEPVDEVVVPAFLVFEDLAGEFEAGARGEVANRVDVRDFDGEDHGGYEVCACHLDLLRTGA